MFPCPDIIMSDDDNDDYDYVAGDNDDDDGYDDDGEKEEDSDNSNSNIYWFSLSAFAMIEHQWSKPYVQCGTTESQQLCVEHRTCVHVIVYLSVLRNVML